MDAEAQELLREVNKWRIRLFVDTSLIWLGIALLIIGSGYRYMTLMLVAAPAIVLGMVFLSVSSSEHFHYQLKLLEHVRPLDSQSLADLVARSPSWQSKHLDTLHRLRAEAKGDPKDWLVSRRASVANKSGGLIILGPVASILLKDLMTRSDFRVATIALLCLLTLLGATFIIPRLCRASYV